MVRIALTCVVGLGALFAVGCSTSSGPDTAEVSGTITLDGEPLEGMEVNFYCTEHDFLATGLTGADGKYTLYSGAAVGENKVWVLKSNANVGDPAAGVDPEENPEADPAQMEAMSGATGADIGATEDNTVPAKFSDPDKSVLKYSVAAGGTDSADFKLTSD